MDDAGFFLIRKAASMTSAVRTLVASAGALLVRSLPLVIRALAVIGTVAMLLVGGGMFTHNLHYLHHLTEMVPAVFPNLLIGCVVGTALVLAQKLVARIRS